MACDAQTLEALLSADKLPSLSDRDRLMCLAAVYGGTAGYTGPQALNAAYADGLAKFSDRQLEEAFLAVICGVPVCPAPTAPVITSVSHSIILTPVLLIVVWTQPANSGSAITGYTVQMGTTQGGPYTLSQTTGPGVFTATFSPLSSGTKYYVIVTANTACGASATSAEGSGTTVGSCSSGNTIATDWASRVVANGGANPSGGTQSAIADFVCGCIADGTWTKMISVNVFAPDNLTACRTPLVKGTGNDPWINTAFIGGDLSVNGLTGNGSTKLLDTGIIFSSFSPLTTGGFVWYCYNNNNDGVDLGLYDEVKGMFGAASLTGNIRACNGTTAANNITPATSGNGYYADVRVSATDHRAFFANSSHAHAQIGSTDTTSWTGPFGSGSITIFSLEDSLGANQLFTSDTLSFVAFTQGFTATDSAKLFTRVQTLRTAFGGGFV